MCKQTGLTLLIEKERVVSSENVKSISTENVRQHRSGNWRTQKPYVINHKGFRTQINEEHKSLNILKHQ